MLSRSLAPFPVQGQNMTTRWSPTGLQLQELCFDESVAETRSVAIGLLGLKILLKYQGLRLDSQTFSPGLRNLSLGALK